MKSHACSAGAVFDVGVEVVAAAKSHHVSKAFQSGD